MILIFVILMPVTVLSGVIVVIRKLNPPRVSDYERHMSNFLSGSDYGELDKALEDEASIRKMEGN